MDTFLRAVQCPVGLRPFDKLAPCYCSYFLGELELGTEVNMVHWKGKTRENKELFINFSAQSLTCYMTSDHGFLLFFSFFPGHGRMHTSRDTSQFVKHLCSAYIQGTQLHLGCLGPVRKHRKIIILFVCFPTEVLAQRLFILNFLLCSDSF